MSTIDTINRHAGPSSGTQASPAGFQRLMLVAIGLVDRMERRRSRLALLEMSDAQLKDIGISRADAYREGLRRFWE